jgi:hypothetical protein
MRAEATVDAVHMAVDSAVGHVEAAIIVQAVDARLAEHLKEA